MRYYIRLIYEFTLSDFKLRFIKTRVGIVWAIIKPFLMFGVLYIILSLVSNFGNHQYVWVLLIGIILWNFFQDAIVSSMKNMLDKKELIRKIAFPFWIVCVSSCLQSFIILMINLFIFMIFYTTSGLLFSKEIIFIAPVLMMFLILTFGLSLTLASLNVSYRDISHVSEIALQIGFWLSPVIYPLSSIPEKYQNIYLLNPVATTLHFVRQLMFDHTILYPQLLSLAVLAVGIFLFGFFVFSKRKEKIIEEI